MFKRILSLHPWHWTFNGSFFWKLRRVIRGSFSEWVLYL